MFRLSREWGFRAGGAWASAGWPFFSNRLDLTGVAACPLKWFSAKAGDVAGMAFLGRVGPRTCSDLGHCVEGGTRQQLCWPVASRCSFQDKHCGPSFALPSLLISGVHPAGRRHTGQPSFGSRLSCEVGTRSGDVFLTLQLPHLRTPPSLLPVQQSVQEAENLLESTREARSNVCLFLKR